MSAMGAKRNRWSQQYLEWIHVPSSLLLTKELTPAAKFLWVRLRFDELDAKRRSKRMRSHAPARLVKRTCLARSTIYEALKRAEATGWLEPYFDPDTGEKRWRTVCCEADRRMVKIPVSLIRASHALRPQAILCYGILQLLPGSNGRTGKFKWSELRALTGLHLRTLKRAFRALVESRWIASQQKNRRAPIWFRLQDADQAYKEEVARGLEKGHLGEGIMRATLSLIADTKVCWDGAKPEFLVNPATGELMELDRYYASHAAAFEFNGPQHYHPTGRFSKEVVTAQRKRDALKRQICKDQDIALVVVHGSDLTLTRMLRKVGDLLPRRVLRGFKQTIRFLNACGVRYQTAAARG